MPESIGESIVHDRPGGSNSISAKAKGNLRTGGHLPVGPLSTSGQSNRHMVAGMSMYSSQQQP